jgi:hypothetical protein
MKPDTSFSKKAFTLGAMTVLSAGTILMAPAAQAATYFNLDFEKAPDNTDLNSFLLDSSSGQTIDGVTYGTKSSFTSVGQIWSDLGIEIFGYDNDYVDDVLNNRSTNTGNRTLGLFQSNCLPSNNGEYDGADGVSAQGFTTPCANVNSGGAGDNDLATGTYYDEDGKLLYDTTPQGNLLIFEENPGRNNNNVAGFEGLGRPDDTANGGTFLFDLTNFTGDWTVDGISIVDDADGQITYFYEDGSNSQVAIDIASNPTANPNLTDGENEVRTFFGADAQKKISKIAVQFDNSGGIGGIRLKEIQEHVPSIPEPTAALGLLAFGAVATQLKRNQRSVSV